jgi:hypothetical protein
MAMWYANPIENVNRLGPKVVKILSLGLWRSLCQESGGSAEQLVTYPSEWTWIVEMIFVVDELYGKSVR